MISTLPETHAEKDLASRLHGLLALLHPYAKRDQASKSEKYRALAKLNYREVRFFREALKSRGPLLGVSPAASSLEESADNAEDIAVVIDATTAVQSQALMADIVRAAAESELQMSSAEQQAAVIVQSLNSLLDICDRTAIANPEWVAPCAEDYIDNGRLDRARALLQTHLASSPDDLEAIGLIANLLEAVDELPEAIHWYEQAIALSPLEPAIHRDLGNALLGLRDYDDSLSALRQAQVVNADDDELAVVLAEELRRAEELRSLQTQADQELAMPAITISESERAEGQLTEGTLALAGYLYHRHGTLLIRDVFDPELLSACNKQFLEQYKAYLGGERQADALQIGHRRFQVSIALHGAFNSPDFYANRFVLPIIQRLLGRKAIVGSTVCATSLPGSRDQHMHKDHRALFTNGIDDTPMVIPPVSVTTMIPLVPVDEAIGSTRVIKGSHRLGKRDSEALPSQLPIVPLGSCFLMDLSLSHQGMGNQTDRVRPIINMVYHQHWFADNMNFKKQPPLQIDRREFEKIPRRHRHLFDWSVQPGPKVNQ